MGLCDPRWKWLSCSYRNSMQLVWNNLRICKISIAKIVDADSTQIQVDLNFTDLGIDRKCSDPSIVVNQASMGRRTKVCGGVLFRRMGGAIGSEQGRGILIGCI